MSNLTARPYDKFAHGKKKEQGQNSTKVSQDEVVVELSGHDAMRPKLKNRHLYMIAMGGCIGTAFLVGSGRTPSTGGPAPTLAGFVTMSSVAWVFATLMFEMAAYMPIDGAGVDTYATRLLSDSFVSLCFPSLPLR